MSLSPLLFLFKLDGKVFKTNGENKPENHPALRSFTHHPQHAVIMLLTSSQKEHLLVMRVCYCSHTCTDLAWRTVPWSLHLKGTWLKQEAKYQAKWRQTELYQSRNQQDGALADVRPAATWTTGPQTPLMGRSFGDRAEACFKACTALPISHHIPY